MWMLKQSPDASEMCKSYGNLIDSVSSTREGLGAAATNCCSDILSFCAVRHCRDIVPQQHQTTWGQFAGWLQQPANRPQKDGMALIFAFGIPSRKDANVTACTAISFDVEQGHEPDSPLPPAPDALHHRLRDMQVAHTCWTTYSHEPPRKSWRLFRLSHAARPA